MTKCTVSQFDFSVIRVAYLPINFMRLKKFAKCDITHKNSIRHSLRQLIKICKNKDIMLVIKFISENLAKKIPELSDEVSIENLKLAASLYECLIKLSTYPLSPTSFTSVMTVANQAENRSDTSPNPRLYLTVDNARVYELAKCLELQAIKDQNQNLWVRKNTSLYKVGDEFRYVAKTANSKANSFKLDAIKINDAIKQVLNIATSRIKIADIVTQLSTLYTDIEESQLLNFVFNLLENQLLESNLTVVIGTNHAFKELYQRAIMSNINKNTTINMEKIIHHLGLVTSFDIANTSINLAKAKSYLMQLLANKELNKWLHVDMSRNTNKPSIDKEKIKPLLKTINALKEYFWQPNKVMDDFTNKFIQVYGEAKVPLLEALDLDNGIVFGQERIPGSPLHKGVLANKQSPNIKAEWRPLDQFIMKEIITALGKNKKVIKITSKDIEKYKVFLNQPKNKFDSSISLHGMFLKQKNGQPLYQIRNISGPSALATLKGYCCGDQRLTAQCIKTAKKEQDNCTDVIMAEVIHTHGSHSPRPSLRDYEIVYTSGDSSLSQDRQIQCDDLYLKIINEQLCLFSQRLNKEIKPRFATAHHTIGFNLPVYQLLHAMQGVGGWITNMSLNTIMLTFPYLPEIRIDNLIISERRWLLNKLEVSEIQNQPTIEKKLASLKKLKKQKNICRYIALSDGNNILEFDLKSPFSALVFIKQIKNKGMITLTQSARDRFDNNVHEKEQTYAHEFIIPLQIIIEKNKGLV